MVVAPFIGLCGAIILKLGCGLSWSRGLFWVTLAWAGHLVLDLFSAGSGSKLLLPFSDVRLSSPLPLLPVAEPHLGGVFGDIVNPAEGGIGYNVIVVLFEIVIFGSLLVLRTVKGAATKILAAMLLVFCLWGSGRQALFRRQLLPGDNPAQTDAAAFHWYRNNLRDLTPWDFALMREPRP